MRDIETCLTVQASKLYGMGFCQPARPATLADANETRDWRIYASLAQRLIAQARKLYADEDLGLDLSNTVYALDSTSIEPVLIGFPVGDGSGDRADRAVHRVLQRRPCRRPDCA